MLEIVLSRMPENVSLALTDLSSYHIILIDMILDSIGSHDIQKLIAAPSTIVLFLYHFYFLV